MTTCASSIAQRMNRLHCISYELLSKVEDMWWCEACFPFQRHQVPWDCVANYYFKYQQNLNKSLIPLSKILKCVIFRSFNILTFQNTWPNQQKSAFSMSISVLRFRFPRKMWDVLKRRKQMWWLSNLGCTHRNSQRCHFLYTPTFLKVGVYR